MHDSADILKRRIQKHFRVALATYRLVDDGDKILVGLSGGKDSLCLLELLALRQRIFRPSFSIEAIHVRMDNISYKSDTSYLSRFCEGYGVPLHIVTTGFEHRPGDRKPVCFLCSWHRRKEMFRVAQERGCNKIALGHHNDDIIHTALMNLIYQGRFSTMPASLRMRKMPLTIIRPLCLEHESDLSLYAQWRHYQPQEALCPFEDVSKRTFIRRLFQRLEGLCPDVRNSLWNALEKDGKLMEE